MSLPGPYQDFFHFPSTQQDDPKEETSLKVVDHYYYEYLSLLEVSRLFLNDGHDEHHRVLLVELRGRGFVLLPFATTSGRRSVTSLCRHIDNNILRGGEKKKREKRLDVKIKINIKEAMWRIKWKQKRGGVGERQGK